MNRSRRTAAILFLACLSGCTSYRTVADPAVAMQASPKPVRKARVTMDTGKRFELMTPRLNVDSIQGSLRDGSAVSVPMSAVQEVELRQYSGGRTGLLVFGGVLAAIGAAIAILAIVITAGA